MKKHYTAAVFQLFLQGRDTTFVLSNLKKVLVAKGHQSLLTDVLRLVQEKLERTEFTQSPHVVVAKELDKSLLAPAIAKALEKLNAHTQEVVYQVDSTLIGGYVATYDGKSIDASFKKKLVTLYRHITK